tara:strand:- start:98 stop:781 length:684 start_codon:yes stop_codon:yes gene_type:complete
MIIITGSSRGIGRYLFKKFWETGTTAYGTFNKTFPDSDKEKYLMKVDISNYSDVKNWIESIRNKIEHLTLINCAGINYTSFAHKAEMDKWSDVINVNLIGTFNVIREILPIMREKSYGRIINFSSVVAQTFVPGSSAYAASKSALWGLTRSIAIENSGKGITINNLNLGYFNLGMIEEVPQEYQTILKNKIPSGNFGNPDNIFKVINMLMDNDYINGTSIDINGGLF